MRGGLHRLLSRASSARAVLALHAAHEPLAPIHLATCWNRLGRATGSELAHLRRGGGKRLEPLRRSTHKSLRRLDAKGLATLAHALGRLRLCGGSETTQPWSELWEGLEEAALRCAARQAFTPQGLSNTAWSHAKAGRRAPALFDALAREAERQADGFNSRDHAITAWAFASAAHAAPSLFDAIAARAGAAPLLGQCSEQSLSNLAWAFATAGHEASELLDAIAGQAAPRLPSFSGQALANTAWAFATASHAAPALFSGIEAEVVARLRAEGGVAPEAAFKPQELSNLAWAFATAGHEAPELLDAIAGEAAPRVGEFSSQGLSMTAWAYAASGRLAPALFDSIAGELAPRVGEFSPQGLSNAAWAFATANHTAPSLLDAIAAQAVALHAELDARCLTATAWSLAVLDMGGNGERGTGGAARFARRFGGWLDSRAAELSHQSLCQLHQWRLWREEERRRSDGLPSAPLLAQAAAAFGATRTRQSEIQSSVGEALAALDTWPEEEVRLPCGYTLDWLVQWRGVSLGVEVDGPRHFLGKRPSGATALKRRQVRAFGTPLVSIPYWEWDGLRDGGARVAFLRRALEREATSKGAEGGSGARGLDGRTSSAASG